MSDMTIGKVAKAVGVGVETIRFYERRGLLDQPPRPEDGGYRVYPDEAVRRVQFIRRAQELGFSLREITELLSLRSAHSADAGDVRRRATVKLQDVDRKIVRLQRIRQGLATLLDRCPGAGPLQCCSILDALEQHDEGLSGELTQQQEEGMQTVRLTIGGMHCEGCTEIVRQVLEQQPGVKGCSVSHENGEARVAVDAALISGEQLAEAVRGAGYSASIAAEAD
ncbi:MerR family transcriptional regulator [Halomonas campisalis]|uniref:Mercuric resistance operon regulatory protein n=1 Tax=Billgrantia campisalis TaxID=74661 RepID=A0ABS9PA69_9GAMM|nr:MerR family transcriptional regulator [Halomonas campisalis]MCG6658147.1 MerR family transcriptional regulator [Halomonas campisalis]MDR5862815.1 MerR family transcriptional regulator [Halomonas campisalis]